MNRLSICSLVFLALSGTALAQPPLPPLLTCSFERLDKGDSIFCTAVVRPCNFRASAASIVCNQPDEFVVTCDDQVVYDGGYAAGTVNLNGPSQELAKGIVTGLSTVNNQTKSTLPQIRLNADFILGASFDGQEAILKLASDDIVKGTCDHTIPAPEVK